MKKWLVASLMALTVFAGQHPIVHADVSLKSLKRAVPITMDTSVSSIDTKPDTDFQMTFSDTVLYKNYVFPKGTRLQGKVREVRQSKRMGRPARVQVQFSEVIFPDGRTVTLDQETKDALVNVGMNKMHSGKSMLGKQALIGVTSLAATVTVGVATGMSGWGIYLIDEAIDFSIGAIQEVRSYDPYDKRSTGRKIATGMLRGATPIPLIVGLAKKAPEVNYQAGDDLQFVLPKPLWKTLLAAHNQNGSLGAEPGADDIKSVLYTNIRLVSDDTADAE